MRGNILPNNDSGRFIGEFELQFEGLLQWRIFCMITRRESMMRWNCGVLTSRHFLLVFSKRCSIFAFRLWRSVNGQTWTHRFFFLERKLRGHTRFTADDDDHDLTTDVVTDEQTFVCINILSNIWNGKGRGRMNEFWGLPSQTIRTRRVIRFSQLIWRQNDRTSVRLATWHRARR